MRRAFVQRIDGRSGLEHWLDAGRLKGMPMDRALLDVVLPLRVRMKEAFAVVLRWTARALWISPIFVVLALVARAAERPVWASAAAVGFALVVVAFFGALAAFVFASLLAHPVSDRVAARLLPPWEVEPPAAPTLRGMPAVGTRVRVRGKLERVSPGEGPVVQDFWGEGDAGYRAITVCDMVVRSEGGLPVVLAPRRAPLVLARRDGARLAPTPELAEVLEEASLAADVSGEALALEPGAEVEVDGTVLRIAPNAQHVELDGELVDVAPGGDDPYRQGPGGPAIVLGDPIVLRAVR
jgi:hypothetical protein